MRIYLLGFMAAGKSTLGAALGKMAGIPFVDLDEEIVSRVGESISDIFNGGGEEHFRRVESATLAEVVTRTELILATGGGVVERPENHLHLRGGYVVYLCWPWEILQERLSLDQTCKRPLNRGDMAELHRRWERRDPIYRELANLVLTLDSDDASAPRGQKLQELSRGILTEIDRGLS